MWVGRRGIRHWGFRRLDFLSVRRSTRIALVSLGGLFTLAALFLLAGFAWLHTEAGAGFLLNRIQSFASQAYRVQISYSRVLFAPFSHLHLEGLKITRDEGGGRLDAGLDELDVRYRILWHSLTVEVESVLVRKPAGFVRFAAIPKSQAGAGGIWLIPVNVTLTRVEVKDARWDVAVGEDLSSKGRGWLQFSGRATRSGMLRIDGAAFEADGIHVRVSGNTIESAWLQGTVGLVFQGGAVESIDSRVELKAKRLVANAASVEGASAALSIHRKGEILFDLTAGSPRVVAGPSKAMAVSVVAGGRVANDLGGGEVEGKVVLGVDEVASFRGKAVAKGAVRVEGVVKATLAGPITDLFPPWMAKYGKLGAALKFSGTLDSPARSLADLDAEKLMSASTTSEVHLDLLQERAVRGGPVIKRVTLDGVMKIAKGGSPITFEPFALNYDGKSLAKGKGTGSLSDGLWKLEAEVDADYGPGLAGVVPPDVLAMVGAGSLKIRAKGSARPPTYVTSTGTTSLTQIMPARLGGRELRVAGPAILTHDVKFDNGVLDAVIGGEVPAPTVAGLPPLGGLKLEMKLGLEGGDRLRLDALGATLGDKLVAFTAAGSARIERRDVQLRGRLAADLPRDFPPFEGNRVSGKVDVPWTLTVMRGREINLTGEIVLEGLGWAQGPRLVRGISGTIPISEECIVDTKGFRLAYVIAQNPFERVDFERIRPLVKRAEMVRVHEIGFEEKRYGPLVGFFSLKQNLLVAHQVDLDLRGAGLVYGETYLDLQPQSRRLGFLTRLTRLDLPKLLPKRYLPALPDEEAKVSGRAGLVFNLTPGTVEGRLDITEVGAPQILLLINAMDPGFENERLNLARKALGFGAPRFVQVAFQKGYADLALDVSLLGTSQHFDVRGLSLSTWVSGASQQVAERVQEVVQ